MVPKNGHQPLGRGNSLWRSAYHIVIKPDLLTLFHGDRPRCAHLPYDSGTPKYMCGLMGP